VPPISRRYPVITGLGVISSLGAGRERFAEGLLTGRSGVIARPGREQDPLPCPTAAPVTDWLPSSLPGQRKNLKLMTRSVMLGLGAATLALEDAGITPGSVAPPRFGGYVGAGTATGDGRELEPALARATQSGSFDLGQFAQQGLPLINPLWLVKGLSNNVLGFISAQYRMMGPNLNICCSGVGGLLAIGEAAQAIRDDRADVCLAGGHDSLLDIPTMALYARLGLLTTNPDPATASRPYHAQRDGFVPGEGAAFLVVEDREHARRRGARILAYVAGFGSTNSARDLATAGDDGRGVLAAASTALQEAGVTPVDMGLVVAHASGSVSYDPAEAEALRRLMGPARDRTPVTAPKSMLGHAVAAAGAFNAATLLVALAARLVPPTLNLDEVAPGCQLAHVRNTPAPLPKVHGLALAAGLAGQHAALYLSKAPL